MKIICGFEGYHGIIGDSGETYLVGVEAVAVDVAEAVGEETTDLGE